MSTQIPYADTLTNSEIGNKGPYPYPPKAGPFTLSKLFSSTQYYLLQNVIDDYIRDPEKYVYQYKCIVNGKTRQIVTYRRSTTEGQRLEHLHKLFSLSLRSTYVPHQLSFAYQKNKNVVMCLNEHIYSDAFLKADIHSYFDTISFNLLLERIQDVCNCPKYRMSALKKIVAACFYQGRLPIGFVSSPILSDIYLKDLDDCMSALDNICYSRYADDFIISSSGNGADKQLAFALNQLKSELAGHKLELNEKKTFIRRLKNEGDSIRLLGLNLVKTKGLLNRITVSHKYLMEITKDLSFLLQNKNTIEPLEMRSKFTSVMGKVTFVTWASRESAAKLQKLLFVKTGRRIELSYKGLLDLLIDDPSVIHEFEQEKQRVTYERIESLTHPLTIGRCWEKVSIPSLEKSNRVSLIYYLTNAICPSIESKDASRIHVNRLSLDIGTDRFVLDAPFDTEGFHEAIRKIRTAQAEVLYSADFFFNGKLSSPRTNHRILFNEESRKWKFECYEKVPASLDEIVEYSEWKGYLDINLACPLKFDQVQPERIDSAFINLRQLLNPWMQKSVSENQNSKSIDQKFEFTMKSTQLIQLMEAVKELFRLIEQTHGPAEVSAWFVPADLLETTKKIRFIHFEVTTQKGKFEVFKRKD